MIMLIIKILLYIYVSLGFFYFIITAKEKTSHTLKHSPGRLAKVISFLHLFLFSLFCGGYKLITAGVKIIKRLIQVYKFSRQLKKFNKQFKKK